jgi:hypothetical protein
MQTDKKRSDRKKKRHEDERVDEAIRETFPASDPAAAGEATGTEPARRPMDRQPPAISREEIEQARKGKGHTQNDSIKRSS